MEMPTRHRIAREQLQHCLKVFNRYTGKPIGYLGSISDDGLVLLSDLPILVAADFELLLTTPGDDGRLRSVELKARCLWSEEDVTPGTYDSGFAVCDVPAGYESLASALNEYFSFNLGKVSA